MRIKILYQQGETSALLQAPPTKTYRIVLNKMPETDVVLKNTTEFYLDNIELNKEKVNVIKIRPVSPNEAEEKRAVVFANILRGLLFGIMAFFLPFAFMSFKSSNVAKFTKIKFEYSETHDFVVAIDPTNFSWGYQPPASVYSDFPAGEEAALPEEPVSETTSEETFDE